MKTQLDSMYLKKISRLGQNHKTIMTWSRVSNSVDKVKNWLTWPRLGQDGKNQEEFGKS